MKPNNDPRARLSGNNLPPEVLDSFFDHFPDPILIWTLDGDCVRLNRAAARMLGYDGEDIPRALFENPFKFLAAEVADRLPDILRQERLKGEISMVVPITCRNGSTLRAEVRSRLLPFGETTYRCMVLRDTATLRDPDTRPPRLHPDPVELSSLFPGMLAEPELVFEMDSSGYFTSASNLALEKTGYTAGDLRKGVHFSELIVPEDRERGGWDFERALRCERIDALEYVLLRKDGATFPVMLSLSRIPVGASQGLRGIALDISEHKRLEQDLMIREKLNTLGEMAGGVVHNFNNILSVILGYLEILPMEKADEHCRKVLSGIRQAARDGAEIVNRIQNFTRIQEPRTGQPSDLNGIVRDALNFLETRTGGCAGKVTVTPSLGDVPPVSVIPSEIREVLGNIFNNALDAMPHGGALTVRTGMLDGFVAVSVTDTGNGMSPETCRRIFEPFFTTKLEKGTGMGMSVSYAIVSKFGGEIRVASREGEGTTITVMLPPDQGSAPEPAPSRVSAPGGRRILVLDDEANICEILHEFLTREGHAVTTARRADAGLECLRSSSFDVLITDLNMPGVSGWEVACRVREQYPETFIIMLTGWGSQVEQLNRRESIVNCILHKPIDFSLLTRVIASAEENR